MIRPKCVRCSEELKEQGALVLGPPNEGTIAAPEMAIVVKLHVCTSCWKKLIEWLHKVEDRDQEQLKLHM